MKTLNPPSLTLPFVHSALIGSPLLLLEVFFMKKITGIYKITNPKGYLYIGQSKDIEHRIYNYRYLSCKGQRKLYRSLKKYGYNNHKFEIIHICNLDELNNLEKYYIDIYNTTDRIKGLNLTHGGDCKIEWTEQSKQKLSKSKKGKKGRVLSKDILKKIGDANRIHRTGSKHSEETKLKMSIAKLGKKKSDETKKRMSIAQAGKKISKESILKNKRAHTGKKASDETKNKMSESAKNAWLKRKESLI